MDARRRLGNSFSRGHGSKDSHMIPMYIVSAICMLLCVPPVAPPIVPPRDSDEFARSRENRESAEVTNAKSMLRIQSDDDLARLSAYLIRLGV
ncbi:MAG: hypothetical protein DWI11_12040, partial [Planctomycetota bacterium]